MKKKIFTVLFLLSIASLSKAQLSSFDFGQDGETMVRVGPRIGYAKNSAVKWPQAKGIGVFTVDAEIFKSNYAKGKGQSYHRWPFIWDVWWPLVVGILRKEPSIAQNGSTSISSFIFGWHQNTWSIVSKENINIALGAHYGDYFYSFQYYDAFGDSYSDPIEPGGWYAAIGPAITVDYALPFLPAVLHYDGGFPYTFRIKEASAKTAEKGFPSPIILNNLLELRFNKFYLGMDYVKVINRGDTPSKGYRVDCFMGVWF